MAKRPVFVPVTEGRALVQEVPVEFGWHAGMAPVQKRKNVAALHQKAAERGLEPLLEISSKSEREIGQKLSAFSLPFMVDGRKTTLECVFQGSKVFESGGPFTDLYWVSSRDAKRDPRLQQSGNLIGFQFEEISFPLSPATAFYDWLYIRALFPHREWLKRLDKCAGFTDIEFNPEKSINCQARSCATFISLEQRGQLDQSVASFDAYRTVLSDAAI